MQTLEHLREFGVSGFLVVALLAGLSVVAMCGVLSVLVVVKKLGFVGQGVSHSAFGGVGLAALLAAVGVLPDWPLAQLVVVVLFCVAAALGMAAVSDKRTVPVDTAIGMFLVGSMALGAVLTQVAQGVAAERGRAGVVQSWEAILFGSILTANWEDVIVGWIVCVAVLVTAWIIRRPLLFWAFDEDSASAFGVRGRAMKTVLMILLALAIVVAMRLAGVVLATALLVLPGAAALKLSDRFWPVTILSVLMGVAGLVLGLVASFELSWQPGPCVVLAMTLLFAASVGWSKLRSVASVAGASAAST
ncbi:MAG: metal ABC transporter permease [Phycisphaerales bacterium]|nr:metal ABC transporter permease [Phycisphaerales bacterium]